MVPAAPIGGAAVGGMATDGPRPLQRQHIVVEPRPPPFHSPPRRRCRRGGEQHGDGEAEEREREEEEALLPAPRRLHHPRPNALMNSLAVSGSAYCTIIRR